MRYLLVMIGLILAGCGGTTVIVVTATPEPTPWIIIVTATPEGTIAPSATYTPTTTASATHTPLPVADPTPTQEVVTVPALNPHEACARNAARVDDCVVSPLYTFRTNGTGMIPVDTPYINGRPFMTVCGSGGAIAACYQPTYTLGSVGVIPFTYCTPGRDSCRMEVHWWDGVAGYCQSVDTTYSRQPYLVQVVYDYRLVGGGLDGLMFGAFVEAAAGRVDLPKQAVNSGREALWAVRSVSDYPELRVCAYIYAPWAVYSEGWIDWFNFQVIALPAGYDGAVIEYE